MTTSPSTRLSNRLSSVIGLARNSSAVMASVAGIV
jgi:hypothetical protein